MITAPDFLKWLEIFKVPFGSGGGGEGAVLLNPTGPQTINTYGLTVPSLTSDSNILVPETQNATEDFPTINMTSSNNDCQIIVYEDLSSGIAFNLPDATTLALNRKFTFSVVNGAASSCSISSYSGGYYGFLPSADSTSQDVSFTCVDNSTQDGVWVVDYGFPSAFPVQANLGGTGISSATFGGLLIGNSGNTWDQVGSIPSSSTYGGTVTFGNSTGYGFSTAPAARTPILSGTVTGGSTGFPAWAFAGPTSNGILYWSTLNLMSSISAVNNAQLTTNGSGVPSLTASLGTGSPVLETDGTFTPVLAFNGASVGVTYSNQSGAYSRVGNTVFFELLIGLTSKGSSTGNAAITGLPITSRNTGTYSINTWYPYNVTYSSSPLIAFIGPSTSSLGLQYATTATTPTNLTDASFANNSQIYISGSYLV